MNKQRRKAIEDAKEKVTQLKDDLQEACEVIEALQEEEQGYYDTMPDSLKGGDKGQAAEAAAGKLQEAVDSITDASNSLDDVISHLEGAVE